MMKRLLLSTLLVLPVCAFAADPADGAFYKKAAQDGMAEVDLGNLAQQKAEDPAVKQFGAKMVKDHTDANDKLKSLAATKSIELPTMASSSDMAVKEKLDKLSGPDFDKAYVKAMVKDHKEDIALFTKESKSGKDPGAKDFAATTLPILQQHLDMVQSMQK